MRFWLGDLACRIGTFRPPAQSEEQAVRAWASRWLLRFLFREIILAQNHPRRYTELLPEIIIFVCSFKELLQRFIRHVSLHLGLPSKTVFSLNLALIIPHLRITSLYSTI